MFFSFSTQTVGPLASQVISSSSPSSVEKLDSFTTIPKFFRSKGDSNNKEAFSSHSNANQAFADTVPFNPSPLSASSPQNRGALVPTLSTTTADVQDISEEIFKNFSDACDPYQPTKGSYAELQKLQGNYEITGLSIKSSASNPLLFIFRGCVYCVNKQIGKGVENDVYLATKVNIIKLKPNQLCVVKVANRSFSPQVRLFQQLSPASRSNPHLDAPLLHYKLNNRSSFKKYLAIFNFSSSDFAHVNYKTMSDPFTFMMSKLEELADGLACLHKVCVHNDLKPENVLFNGSAPAKITDFGCAQAIPMANEERKLCGTPAYWAPFIWNTPEDLIDGVKGHQGPEADLFSYGGMVLSILEKILNQMGERYQVRVEDLLDQIKPRAERFNLAEEGTRDALLGLIHLCPGRVICHRRFGAPIAEVYVFPEREKLLNLLNRAIALFEGRLPESEILAALSIAQIVYDLRAIDPQFLPTARQLHKRLVKMNQEARLVSSLKIFNFSFKRMQKAPAETPYLPGRSGIEVGSNPVEMQDIARVKKQLCFDLM